MGPSCQTRSHGRCWINLFFTDSPLNHTAEFGTKFLPVCSASKSKIGEGVSYSPVLCLDQRSKLRNTRLIVEPTHRSLLKPLYAGAALLMCLLHDLWCLALPLSKSPAVRGRGRHLQLVARFLILCNNFLLRAGECSRRKRRPSRKLNRKLNKSGASFGPKQLECFRFHSTRETMRCGI